MNLNNVMSALMPSVLQPYVLEVRRAGGLDAALDVVRFEGVEKLGEPCRFTIQLTHPLADLPRASFLGMPATFRIAPPQQPGAVALAAMAAKLGMAAPDSGAGRTIQGYITGFSQTDSNPDVGSYEIVLESRLALLRNVTRCRLFLDQTFPQIIETILREQGFSGDGSHFAFTLLREYEQRPIVTQWHETDLAFIQRLCRRGGIWFRIDAGEWGEIVHFGDDFTHYRRQPALSAPLRPHAGLESVGLESVRALRTRAVSIAESVVVGDYNRLAAPTGIEAEANLARNEKSTFGATYAWGAGHLDARQAEWEGRLRHEAQLAGQIVYAGDSNVLGLVPGAVFRLTNHVPPDAEYGQLITCVTHCGARDTAYHNSYSAIPSDRIYRLPLDEAAWPRIGGTVSARVASPDRYQYAYMNEAGDYRVRFDFDRDPRTEGANSCWMRLAKPFAGGGQTGFHFPLLDGAEVAIAFHDGDPDRPYISHALHDSRNGDLITNQDRWMSRNLIRTQSNNKLRMEDFQGQEHIKLATEGGGKSQLNLGHLVDAKKQSRGEGVELRTDGWGSVRAGKGLFLSADAQPRANGPQLDMQAAQVLLDQALQQMQALSDAAKAAQAIAADYAQQKALLDDTLTGLKQAGVLMSAPAGMALTSGGHLQLSAAKNVIVTAGGNADIGVMKKFTVAAGEAVSLFAQKLGMKLFAAKGKVEIQAQSDEMALTSLKDLKITSVNGKLILSARKEIWIGAGGSYIKITPEHIESGTPGDIYQKCAHWEKTAAVSAVVVPPCLPNSELNLNQSVHHAYAAQYQVLRDEQRLAQQPYLLKLPDGSLHYGLTDAIGKTIKVGTDSPKPVELTLLIKDSWDQENINVWHQEMDRHWD